MKSIALKRSWLGLAGILLLASPKLAPAVVDRSFLAAYLFLNLDGTAAGFLRTMEGGGVSAEVIELPSGPSFTKKTIGTPKYEDISMQIGFSMSRVVYDWIAASWQMNFQRKNGSIVTLNPNFDAVGERQFFNALITEVGIPACDGSSKEPGYLTLKIAPEYTRVAQAGGKLPSLSFAKQPSTLWLSSNFRLTIDGLNTQTVNKIDAFTVKQKLSTDSIGDARDYLKEPGKIEFPNLNVTLSTTGAQSWTDWHEDFVIKGNNGDDKEKNGMLEFLSPNQSSVLARIRFFNVGILSLGPARPAMDPCNSGCPADSFAIHEAARRVQAELYVERMEFEVTR